MELCRKDIVQHNGILIEIDDCHVRIKVTGENGEFIKPYEQRFPPGSREYEYLKCASPGNRISLNYGSEPEFHF
jgi:hypothetical protein